SFPYTTLFRSVFYFCKLFVQFHDLLCEPPYGFPSGCCTIFQPYARFCILYDLSCPAVAASSQFCLVPDLSDPFSSQFQDVLRKRRFLQDCHTESPIYFSECVLIFRKIDLHLPVQPVHAPVPV